MTIKPTHEWVIPMSLYLKILFFLKNHNSEPKKKNNDVPLYLDKESIHSILGYEYVRERISFILKIVKIKILHEPYCGNLTKWKRKKNQKECERKESIKNKNESENFVANRCIILKRKRGCEWIRWKNVSSYKT